MEFPSHMVSLIDSLKLEVESVDLHKHNRKQSLLDLIGKIETVTKEWSAKYQVNTDDIVSKLDKMSDQDIANMIDESSNADDQDQDPDSSTDDKDSQTDEKESSRLLIVNDYSFSIENTALIMIDFQRDFLCQGGFGDVLGNDVKLLQPCMRPAKHMLDKAREVGMTVIHTLEAHLGDLSDVPQRKVAINDKVNIGDQGPMGRILIRNEPGNNIVDMVAPNKEEKWIYKPGKGAFYSTQLEEYLRAKNITHLMFAGVTTEVCVYATMCEARDRGFYGLLLTDATASYFPKFKKTVQDMIVAQNHIVGWTATTKQVIDALDEA